MSMSKDAYGGAMPTDVFMDKAKVTTPPDIASPTITVAHVPKILITDNAVLTALHNIKWKEDT